VGGIIAPLWRGLTLDADGVWVAPGHLGPGPFSVRITDTRGHRVVIAGVTLRPVRMIRTRTWMYARPAGPAAVRSASRPR
jgi:hypothetical protein